MRETFIFEDLSIDIESHLLMTTETENPKLFCNAFSEVEVSTMKWDYNEKSRLKPAPVPCIISFKGMVGVLKGGDPWDVLFEEQLALVLEDGERSAWVDIDGRLLRWGDEVKGSELVKGKDLVTGELEMDFGFPQYAASGGNKECYLLNLDIVMGIYITQGTFFWFFMSLYTTKKLKKEMNTKQIFSSIKKEFFHTLQSRFDGEKTAQILSTRILYRKTSSAIEYESIYYSFYRDSAYESLDSCKVDLSKIPVEKNDSFKTEFINNHESMCVNLPEEFKRNDENGNESDEEIFAEENKEDAIVEKKEVSGEMSPRKNTRRQKDNSLPMFVAVCAAILIFFYILKVKFIN